MPASHSALQSVLRMSATQAEGVIDPGQPDRAQSSAVWAATKHTRGSKEEAKEQDLLRVRARGTERNESGSRRWEAV
jgi:hypothetical protein